MTIKAPSNASKLQRELFDFMQEFSITIKLAAKLLECPEYTVSRYKSGVFSFTKKELIMLKRNYKSYMQKKLDNMKV
jgi:hypothetical protein